MNNIEEYKKYMQKCEMLGTNMFKFMTHHEDVLITKYIENEEQERLVKVPDFVHTIINGFCNVRQRLKIVGGKLKSIDFREYVGDKLDLSKLNTKEIRNIKYMFYMCGNLEEVTLDNFNTSNVVDMSSMFHGCSKLRQLDVSSFDTSKVINMKNMFNGCRNLKKLDISNFDTSGVEIKRYMFTDCKNLKLIITNNKTKQWLEIHRKSINLPKGVRIEVRK